MKRLVAILITLAICMSLASPALAANHSRHNIADVLSVANEYGVRMDVLASDDEMQHYISLNKDQFISLIEEIGTSDGITYESPQQIIQVSNPGAARMVILSDMEASYLFSEWAPMKYYSYLGPAGMLFVWKYVQFDYNYSYPAGSVPKFTGYRNVDSWLAGVAVEGWTQTGSSVNFVTTVNYKDTARISVTGYGFLGIDYEGVHFCIQTPPETWNKSLRLVP